MKYTTTEIIVCGLSGLMVFSLLIACAVALMVSPAMSAEDHFGREYTAAVSYVMSPAIDQWVGLRFSQVRDGMPGIWYEFRAGDEWNTGTAGATIATSETTAIAIGAGVSFKDHDSGTNFHFGVIKKLWKVDLHAGYNTYPGSLSFGCGLPVW